MLKWFKRHYEPPKPGEVSKLIVMAIVAIGVYIGLHGLPG